MEKQTDEFRVYSGMTMTLQRGNSMVVIDMNYLLQLIKEGYTCTKIEGDFCYYQKKRKRFENGNDYGNDGFIGDGSIVRETMESSEKRNVCPEITGC